MATRLQEIRQDPVACCTAVTESRITTRQAEALATTFKALSDPHRVRIVNLLANTADAICVCDFMPKLGLSQGTVSFHLKKLLDAGILDREQRGTWSYYSLKPDALQRLSDVFPTKGA